MSSMQIDSKSACRPSKARKDFYYFWIDGFSFDFLPSFMGRYEQAIHNAEIGEKDLCQKYVDLGVAVVKFRLASPTVTRIQTKLRYSDSDYVSNIGKTIVAFSLYTYNHHEIYYK